jgi:membrane protein insertase Oxa1/YidC/SpoIIIJ
LAIEAIHVNIGTTWLESIALFAIIMRLCLLPITIKSQQVSGKLRKLGPEMAHFNEKMNDARMSGNTVECMNNTIINIKHYNASKSFLI